jgi:hypothetical protein
MKCTEFEREWQELDSPFLFSPAMDEHVHACAGCAKLVREVNLLRWEARQLADAEQPSAQVWANIQSQLSRESILRPKRHWDVVSGSASWLNEILSLAWLPRLPMSVAYASVFFLALVGVEYVRDQVTPSPVAVSSAPAAPVAADLAGAREQAVASASGPAAEPAREEEKVIQRVIEKAPPERRAVLVKNWQQVKDSVDESQRFLNEHPDDPLAIEQLFIMQQQRTHFVGTVVRMEEF